ncbi:MAG TPA: divalent-cation tolerance protein CutA [Burkholderiaceae bacterium]|jgi:periplasmic divalent cation tolerance protein|nr:divalent-cation tolerance protein CutA [Burkholderiaceae bacterium]
MAHTYQAQGSDEQPDDVVVVLGNAPDMLLAKRIAHMLVEEYLAACVNLGAPCLSMYMWEDKLEGTEEIPLLMKTTRGRVPALIERYRQLHPYEVPELLVLPVLGGLQSYMEWVRVQARQQQ